MKFLDKSDKAHFNYFTELGKIENINGSENVLKLFKQYNETNCIRIKNRIIESHLKLVIKMVNNFVKSSNESIYNDLVNEGNLGLLEAFDNFDVDKGNAFATFASPYIYRNLFNFSNNTMNMVRQPERWSVKSAVSEIAKDLRSKNNDEPSVLEIIEEYNKIPNKQMKLTLFKYNEIYNLYKPAKSFEQPISGTDEKLTLGCVMATEDNQTDENIELIENIKTILTDIEFKIVDLHLGLTSGEEFTFAQIEYRTKYTAARISQLYRSAINKLKDKKEILAQIV